jgi:DNA replication protein DnaC
MLEVGHPDYGKVVPCKCQVDIMTKARKERMLKYCQLPDDSEGMTFESFRTSPQLKEAFDAAKAVAAGDIMWLTLLSKVDRGKTHLAVAICRDRLARGEPAKYAYVPLLLDELRAGYNDESYQARMQQFLDVSLLVLDDLGVTKKPSDWAMEKLNTIIDYRYINGKDLVVTMNCPVNAIPGDDEGRIGSRLQRVRNGRVIAMEAPEYRLVDHAV